MRLTRRVGRLDWLSDSYGLTVTTFSIHSLPFRMGGFRLSVAILTALTTVNCPQISPVPFYRAARSGLEFSL